MKGLELSMLNLMDLAYLANTVSADGSGWDITSFLSNATDTMQQWGGAFLVLVGVVGVVWASFQIISGLMSGGKKQVSYGTQAFLLLVSGALATTGLSLVMNIAAGGKATIEGIAAGSTISMLKGLDVSTVKLLLQNGLLF